MLFVVREIILPSVRELRPLGIVRCKPSKFCKLGTVSRGEIPYISDKIPRFNHSGCLLINNIREILLIKYQLTSFKVIDTSIAQARNGKDIQGIPWEMLNISRERYKLTRLEQYRNFEDILTSGDVVGKMDRVTSLLRLLPNTFRTVDVPVTSSFTLTKMSWTIGTTHIIASNNDCGVREYDIERFQPLNNFQFSWPVNHTSISPEWKLMTVVGDNLNDCWWILKMGSQLQRNKSGTIRLIEEDKRRRPSILHP
ncbi:hypothetical protein JHK85_056398 [Glycine max]|nr:hypothetical protein JHK86_055385 [Glycine max]KAG4918117.1 hypothetical protein JHK85_056398 [Glycine max]